MGRFCKNLDTEEGVFTSLFIRETHSRVKSLRRVALSSILLRILDLSGLVNTGREPCTVPVFSTGNHLVKPHTILISS